MPRVKSFNEDHTLEKAMTLFWEKGFSATSIQDLVNHLGINRASLYDTYGGKEELFQKSFKRYLNLKREKTRKFFESEPDVKTGLKKLFLLAINECVSDVDKKGCFMVNTTTELIPGDLEMVQVLAENKKNIETLFFDYLKKGESQGQIKEGKDLKSIASLFFTYYSGLTVVTKVEEDKALMRNTVMAALTLLE